MDKPQLFLFHFAGGNRYSFQFIAPLLTDFEVIPLELPGRGRRMDESLLTRFEAAAKDIYHQVSQRVNGNNVVLYGHSLGAYIAFKICGLLENDGIFPTSLVVSGNPGPGAKEMKNRHLMEQEEFIKELKMLGGVPEEFLNEPELFSLFEPILRADFELAEKNGLENEAPVKAPLFAMMGEQEEGIEKIANWGRFSSSRFDHELLEGDHFFIYKHPQRIADIIRYCYQKAKPIQQEI
ncbi:alpha/beta fold hydrolase [Chitinophaga sp.]|uniref:thioesterase II family protein n=1 Tax=Chitinophaga sp. TaxID=1869181 RepID=UPI0031D68762